MDPALLATHGTETPQGSRATTVPALSRVTDDSDHNERVWARIPIRLRTLGAPFEFQLFTWWVRPNGFYVLEDDETELPFVPGQSLVEFHLWNPGTQRWITGIANVPKPEDIPTGRPAQVVSRTEGGLPAGIELRVVQMPQGQTSALHDLTLTMKNRQAHEKSPIF